MRRIPIIDKLCFFIFKQSLLYEENVRRSFLLKYDINPQLISRKVRIDNISNITIGKGSYINSGMIFAGFDSKIIIGENCAIGYNVSIKSRTHDKNCPTGKDSGHIEKDIVIGDNVWIGDNVFIREGVVIGNNCIVGANSVVTKCFDDNLIVGGVPAKIIGRL